MRLSTVAASATLLVLLAGPAARACALPVDACAPRVRVFPLTTPEGRFIGTVEAPIRRSPVLERSRFTGQPRTVLYNDPDSLPGSIDPEVVLVPLPRVKPFRTQAVYPRGY